MLRRFNVRDSDLEDLAQEVFLVVWRRWREYDPSRPLRPWLAGIGFRVAYNHRARFSREIPEPWLEQTEDPDADPEKGRAEADMRGVLQRALHSIGEKHRAVVVLHDMDEIPMRDLAPLLGIPLYTAYSRLREGRKKLLAALRRIQLGALRDGEFDLPGRLEELLARERKPLPLPADRKRNAVARLRALVPLLPPVGQPSDVPLRLRPPMAIAARIAGLIGIAGALVLGVVRGSSPAPQGRASMDPVVLPAQSAAPAAPSPASPLTSEPAAARASAMTTTFPAPLGTEVVSAPDAVLNNEGLVGYWRLDDGEGSAYARDLSGGGNDCTLRRLDRGTAWTEGRHATAIQLDGRGWLECPQTAAVDRAWDEMTIALWVKRSGSLRRVRALVTRQLGHGAKDVFHLGFRDDTLILQSSLWPVTLATGFPTVPSHRWHHVVATRGADRLARLYLDGVLVASKKTGLVGAATERGPLIIGGGNNGPNPGRVKERFGGFIDDVMVFARALGAAEIAALAAGSQPRVSQ